MKKILLSLIALLLCFCTVFTLASCGKKGNENYSDSDSGSASDGETNPAEEEISDADPSTALIRSI